MTKEQEFRKQIEEAKFEAFSAMCEKVAELEKENAELKEISKLLLWDVRSGDYDAKDVERAERFLKECGLEGIM